MIDVSIDKNFALPAWRTRATGAGVVAVAGAVLSTSSIAGDISMRDCYVPVIPGQTVELEVYARTLTGTGAGIFFDLVPHNAAAFTTPEKVLLESTHDDWRRYRLAYTVPHKTPAGSFLRVSLGVPTALAGSAQYLAPVIRTRGGYGTPLVLARGLIRLEAGVVSVHPNFPSHGIAGVAYNGVDTITVTLDHELMTAPENVRCLVHVSGTPDQAALPLAGFVAAGAAPTFQIKWTDGAAFKAINAVGNHYAFVTVTL